MFTYLLFFGFVSFLLLWIYAGILFSFYKGWKRLDKHPFVEHTLHTSVSVVVPFYNESQTLEHSLNGLVHQDFPESLVEIILVDDFSTDGSVTIAEKFAAHYPRIKVLKNQNRGKKGALETGINEASTEIIVIADADCFYPRKWLQNLVGYFETYNPNMIVGPMKLETGSTFFQKFQAWEYVSLMGTTAGAIGNQRPIMCNGANLAFRKSVYQQLSDPFKRKFTSGDDVFLLHQFKAIDNQKIHYLKATEAIVTTHGGLSVTEFLKQRFRWTSKSTGYRDVDTLFVASTVGIVNLLVPVLLVFAFANIVFLCLFFAFIGIKTLIDGWFFKKLGPFFNQTQLPLYLPVFEFFYALYVVVLMGSVFFTHKMRRKIGEMESRKNGILG